ncbi:hypothetical protein N7490_004784 [Penicillium lividum]|nr:hypothetical protein N7490_004784 [Penicillium lividum]
MLTWERILPASVPALPIQNLHRHQIYELAKMQTGLSHTWPDRKACCEHDEYTIADLDCSINENLSQKLFQENENLMFYAKDMSGISPVKPAVSNDIK